MGKGYRMYFNSIFMFILYFYYLKIDLFPHFPDASQVNLKILETFW